VSIPYWAGQEMVRWGGLWACRRAVASTGIALTPTADPRYEKHGFFGLRRSSGQIRRRGARAYVSTKGSL